MTQDPGSSVPEDPLAPLPDDLLDDDSPDSDGPSPSTEQADTPTAPSSRGDTGSDEPLLMKLSSPLPGPLSSTSTMLPAASVY